MEITDKIKLCPFCGSKDTGYFETDFSIDGKPFFLVVKCGDCNANIYAESGELDDSIVLWNKRKESEVKK